MHIIIFIIKINHFRAKLRLSKARPDGGGEYFTGGGGEHLIHPTKAES